MSSWLLDQMAGAFLKLAQETPRFLVVDSRGTLTDKNQWNDEVHPKKAGFKLLAQQCWVPVLKPLLQPL